MKAKRIGLVVCSMALLLTACGGERYEDAGRRQDRTESRQREQECEEPEQESQSKFILHIEF